jgi:hypothetical protein
MSYVAEYWAAGDGLMLGGVRRSRSSRWGTQEEAERSLANTIRINGAAGRQVEGRVVTSPLPPEIFAHCPGEPSQAVGAVCFGCKKKLTRADAAAYEAAQRGDQAEAPTHHFVPLYHIEREYIDRGVRQIIERNLTLAQAQAHCRDRESRSTTATSAKARALTDRVGAWIDRYDEQKVRRGSGRVQKQRRVEGPSPEHQARLRRRFAAARPHGLCERADRCVEHERDPRVGPCNAGGADTGLS